MGTLGLDGNVRAATEFRAFQRGIHLGLSNFQGGTQEGVDRIDPAALIRSGRMVTLGPRGFIQANGAQPLQAPVGIAKWDSDILSASVVVDEPITLEGTTARPLRRNVQVSGLVIRSGTLGSSGNTTYAVSTDYTFDATTGTVARVGGGNIADGATVYATYTFQLTARDFEFEGLPFNAQFGNDMTTYQAGRLTVIKGRVTLFTTEWETDRDYQLMSELYCSENGQFTSRSRQDPGSAADDATNPNYPAVGRVMQLPYNGGSYMGIEFYGDIRPRPAA